MACTATKCIAHVRRQPASAAAQKKQHSQALHNLPKLKDLSGHLSESRHLKTEVKKTERYHIRKSKGLPAVLAT